MKDNNGKYDMVTVVGVAVSVIALVAIIAYKPGSSKKEQATNTITVQQEAQSQGNANTSAVPPQSTQPAASEGQAAQGTSANTQTTAPEQPQQAPAAPAYVPQGGEERLVSNVAEPRTRGTLGEMPLQDSGAEHLLPQVDLEGNGIVSIELPEYTVESPRRATGNPAKVKLASHDYPFLAITSSWLAGQGFGKATKRVLEGEQPGLVLERRSASGKLLLRETWKVLDASKYELAYDIEIVNEGTEAVTLSDFYVEGGAMPTSVTPAGKSGPGDAGGLTLGNGTDKPRFLSMKDLLKLKDGKRMEIQATPIKWTAVHSKYFLLSLWLTEGNFSGAEIAPVVAGTGDEPTAKTGFRYHVRAKVPSFTVDAGNVHKFSIKAYAGPKNFTNLAAYDMRLESVMDMDHFFWGRPRWMGALSKCLLKMLVWISKIFPKSIGYGLGVILLTLLIKLIFWPLSHKSTVSMRKMAALRPQLDEIRAKYKDDPQTMYRKQQELFKQNDVSQLGGCLPMLLQIPVFFALFNTFRNAIELRHAGFLWAYDLSVPDTLAFSPERIPIRPLALLMGALMYYQQKLTPNPDPQQSKIMKYMSIIFILLFYGMPAALTLYLSVSYVLGIVQTIITNKMMPPVSTPAVKTK